jgi:hypothetical protein
VRPACGRTAAPSRCLAPEGERAWREATIAADANDEARSVVSCSENVAQHAAAVVDVGGQRPVAGGAARSDLGEAAVVEQEAVVYQLCVDGVDGDLAVVVDAADAGLDRAGGVDCGDQAGAVAPEAAHPAGRVEVDAGRLAVVVDVGHKGHRRVVDVDRGDRAVAAAQEGVRRAGGVGVHMSIGSPRPSAR